MSERTERFNAAWAKWRALQNVEFLLVGLCAYTRPSRKAVKTGAGMLADA